MACQVLVQKSSKRKIQSVGLHKCQLHQLKAPISHFQCFPACQMVSSSSSRPRFGVTCDVSMQDDARIKVCLLTGACAGADPAAAAFWYQTMLAQQHPAAMMQAMFSGNHNAAGPMNNPALAHLMASQVIITFVFILLA